MKMPTTHTIRKSRLTTRLRRLPGLTALCGAVLVHAPAASEGAVIFQDTFERAGASIQVLNGSTTTTGGLIWTADASVTTENGGGDSYARLGNAGFVAFTPTTGNVYTLDVVMRWSGAENAWGAFGFATTSTAGQTSFVSSANGAPWMLSAWWGNSVDTFAGPGASNPVADGGYSYDRTAFNTFTIVLDTTEIAWQASFYINGTPTGSTYTYSSNPSITHIGFGNENSVNGNAYQVDTVTLSMVPEPGTCGLFAAGGLVLVALRRGTRRPVLIS